MFKKIPLLFAVLLSTFVHSQTVSPNPKKWHKVTVEFTSANTFNENLGDALFFDYRLNVTLTSPSNKTYLVPGYFAADGDAAESGATSGNKWQVNFLPDETGNWTYSASFRTGTNVAISTSPSSGTATDFDGQSGSFNVTASDKTGKDFRGKGKLQYVGERYMKWSETGAYFLEFGADSPEVFLEYSGFDNTPSTRTYPAHVSDWSNGDPTWNSGTDGKGIIGVVNHMSNADMNVHYFLTMNSFGDGKKAYPWTGNNTTNQYDVSKLAQWEIVFDHMMKKGIMPEFVLSETENQSLFENNEGTAPGGFADTRKLYYREMVARFGYLNAVVWNLGEEIAWDLGGGIQEPVTTQQQIDFANYLKNLLPYKTDLITEHNGPSTNDDVYDGIKGNAAFNGISYQGNYQTDSYGHSRILYWINQSASQGKQWVVRYTEPYVGTNANVDIWREKSLWASLTAGGAGIQYYDGGGRDLTTQDYNTLAPYFSAMKYAKDFFEDNNIPFNEMSNNDAGTSNGWMLSKTNQVAVVYLPDGGSSNVNAGTSGTFTVKWYDPRNGGSLQNGSVTSITADGSAKSIGNAPNNTTSDWVVLLENGSAPTGAAISINNTTVVEGTNAVLTVTLNNAISGGFTVDFATQDDSATAGTDYTTNNSTLTFAGTAGETQTITIVTTDDATMESTEHFFVNLTNATNGVTISENQGVVPLTDNDGTPGCTSDYNEVDGTVVIEAENLNLPAGWNIENSTTGFTGTGYINWTGGEFFNAPGNGIITSTIQINTPGTYVVQWRSKIGVGSSNTDNNDTWLRFNDASDFFAVRNSNTIYPQGSGQTPNVNGSGGGNWFKTYTNNRDWSWQTKTNDNTPYEIFVRFDSPGVYSMEISARSKNHFIDRITLSSAGGNQDLGLTETLCDSSPIAVTGVDVNPATGNIAIGNTIQLTRTITPSNATDQTGFWYSNATGVATVSSNGLVTGISEGSVIITYTTNDGAFTAIASIIIETVDQEINKAPVAVASATVVSGVAPLEVSFDGSGSTDDVGVTNYSWDFGDGNFSTLANPTHIFTSQDVFNVSLTVSDVENLTNTTSIAIDATVAPNTNGVISLTLINSASNIDLFDLIDGRQIDVNTLQAALFNIRANTNPNPVASVSIALSGPVNKTQIENVAPYALFGDSNGNYAGQALPLGYYTITAIAYSGSNLSGNQIGNPIVLKFEMIEGTIVNQAPTAVVSANIVSGEAPLEVIFNGSNSTDDDGITSYAWDFGDGNFSTLKNPTHSFISQGTFNVLLTVTDAENLTNSTSISIETINPTVNQAPTAVITTEIVSGDVPLEVNFIGSGSTDDAGIVSYAWDFGDGSTSTLVNPKHTFTSENIFNVSLTVTDIENLSNSTSISIETVNAMVNEAPIAIATADMVSGDMPFEVNFYGSGSTDDKGIVSYAWDFGDGNFSTLTNPKHTFTSKNIFNVTLTVTDIENLSNSTSISIETVNPMINEAPTAIVFADIVSGDVPLEVNFNGSNSTDDDGITSYAWDFGDGNSSILANPTHTFTEEGTFLVSLTVTDVENLTNRASITINATVDPNTEGVVSFTLINSIADIDLFNLNDGMQIDKNTVQASFFNIRANTNSNAVGSVSLQLSGPINKMQTENIAPYALFGDSNGNYSGQALPLGKYTITAKAYSGSNLSGSQLGDPYVLQFTLVNNVNLSVNLVTNTLFSLDEEELASKSNDDTLVKIYPNPASVKLNVQSVSIDHSTITHINLFDMHGRLVKRNASKNLLLGENQFQLQLDGIEDGIYILQVILQNGKVQLKKVIIKN